MNLLLSNGYKSNIKKDKDLKNYYYQNQNNFKAIFYESLHNF